MLLAILEVLGVDVLGWFSELWDALTGIGLGYLVAGWTLQTAQTTLTAFGWYSILRVAFPDGRVAYLQILAAYAAGVALNGFLPANIGTFVDGADVRRDHPRREPARACSAAWSCRRSSSPSPARSSTSTCSCRCRGPSTSSCPRCTTTRC